MQSEAAAITDLAGKLRRMAPADARLARALFDARTRRLTAAAGIRLAPAAAMPPSREPSRLTLRSAGGRLDVLFDAGRHPALGIAGTAEDDALRQVLGALVLAPQLGQLSKLLGRPVELAALSAAGATQASGDAQAGLAVAIHMTAAKDAGHELATTLRTRDDVFPAMLDACLEATPFRLPRALRGLALPGRVRLGGARYPSGLVATLRPGDVLLQVLAPGATPEAIPDVTIGWGAARGRRMQTRGRLHGRTITIEEVVTMSDETVDFPDTLAEGDEGGAPIAGMEALEVPVHLELDTLALPLGQIAGLLPGHVVELPVAVTDTRIRLVAYGQTLGVGQLLAVGDNLGLQIVRMFERRVDAALERAPGHEPETGAGAAAEPEPAGAPVAAAEAEHHDA